MCIPTRIRAGGRAWLACGVVALAACGGTGAALVPAADAAGPTADAGSAPLDAAACDDAGLTLAERGDLLVATPRPGVTLDACGRHRYSLVAAVGSELEITASVPAGDLIVTVLWPDDPDGLEPLATVAAAPGAPAHVPFAAPRSGEFLVTVRTATGAPAVYDLALACTAGCELEATRFPIVLVHGWCGFDNIGPYEYFYGVPEHLRARGYAVEVAHLDPYNSTEVRSAQLAPQLDEFQASTRSRRLDLIGHSQGGIDSRRAIAALGRGPIVATLVTISTPHAGTRLADLGLGYLPGTGLDAFFFLNNLIGVLDGHESDAEAAYVTLSEAYMQGQFAAENPDDPGVKYVSWGGHTCGTLDGCPDVCDAELYAGYEILKATMGDNDGLVPVSSMPHGEWRGLVEADHLDEIGQVGGVTNPSFDHREFYVRLARDLRADGF